MSRPVHYSVSLDCESQEAYEILKWLEREWTYARAKFGSTSTPEHDDDMAEHGLDADAWWTRQIFQYMDRVRVLGLDSYAGRQAAIKMFVTMFGCLESVQRVHGDFPEPGHTSGEIVEPVGLSE